jgi:hypothetical protein
MARALLVGGDVEAVLPGRGEGEEDVAGEQQALLAGREAAPRLSV